MIKYYVPMIQMYDIKQELFLNGMLVLHKVFD